MVKLDIFFSEEKVSRINEFEKERYINFLLNSYKDNLEHAKFVQETYPRWTIISGYYAMHDISKLLLAKEFNLKIEKEVHATTIKLIENLIKNKKLFKLYEEGYNEFNSLATDLNLAKRERAKTQYYTGSNYSKDEFKRKSKNFISHVVEPYLIKIEKLLGELK